MHNTTINIPLFLSKLWKIVTEPDTDDYICWSDDGTSFIIHNSNEFATNILPQYFKHNQYASFVRQLNMYGFRKIAAVDFKGEQENQEFYSPYFQKERSELLYMIKRKVTAPKGSNNIDSESKQAVQDILLDVHAIQGKQENMDTRLEELKSENKALWTEVADLRRRHQEQEKLVKSLVNFLVNLYHGSIQNNPNKRKMPYLQEGSRKILKLISGQSSSTRDDDNVNGPVIHELTDSSSGVGESNEPGIVMSPMSSTLNTPQPPDMSPKLDHFLEEDEETVPFTIPSNDRFNPQLSFGPLDQDLSKFLIDGVNRNNLASHVADVDDQLGIVKQQFPGKFGLPSEFDEFFGPSAWMGGDKPEGDVLPDLAAISNSELNRPTFLDPTQNSSPIGNEIVQYNPTNVPVDITSEMDLGVPAPSLTDFESFLSPVLDDSPLD